MAQSTEESFLDKLLRTRYPLTYYLSRQQQFSKLYSGVQTIAQSTSVPDTTVDSTQKRQIPLPPPACFDVPDTLDFDSSQDDTADEMDDSISVGKIGIQGYDETLLSKNRISQISETRGDVCNLKHSSILQHTSAIELEFSPYENSSPLEHAIQNGLNTINR